MSEDDNCRYCSDNKPFILPEHLVNQVVNNNLVVFAGAGVSTEKNTVFPTGFSEEIAEELNVSKAVYGFADLMTKYCNQPDGKKKLWQRIKSRIDYVKSFPVLTSEASSFHRELASIPLIKTIFTTNWDDFFEIYSGAVPIVTPEDFAFREIANRKVFKIHGSINNVASIVATKEDYSKCYKKLNNGALGASMKEVLSTKTIVFVGYSFGDEDFNRIYSYLKREFKDIFPHSYMVSTDETIREKFANEPITPIVTDATFFIHKLRQELINRKIIFDNVDEVALNATFDMVKGVKSRLPFIKTLNIKKFPEVVFLYSYLQGVSNAFDRYLVLKNTGSYNCPGCSYKDIRQVQNLRKIAARRKLYFDAAYIDGYKVGLMHLTLLTNPDKALIKAVLKDFPFYYFYGYDEDIDSIKEYLKVLKIYSGKNKLIFQHALRVAEKMPDNGYIPYHVPFLSGLGDSC